VLSPLKLNTVLPVTRKKVSLTRMKKERRNIILLILLFVLLFLLAHYLIYFVMDFSAD